MNMRSSLIAFGLGAAAYRYASRNNMLSNKSMKRAKKMVRSYL
ncbi:YrzQ family protein [Ectobacillus panaciterrae]|nr:YrzQ family protein [Ectobacillus panaciterrae]